MIDVKIKVAVGDSEKTSKVENVETSWNELLIKLRTPKVQPGERSYIVPGWCDGGVRNAANVKTTTLAMIDIDDKAGASGLRVEDLADELEFCFPYLWALYTTRSYDGHNACCRLVVPYDGELAARGHGEVVRRIVGLLPDSWQGLVDRASYLPYQAMFLPCVREEGAPFETYSGGRRAYPVGDITVTSDVTAAVESGQSNLSIADVTTIDLTDEEVDDLLDKVDPAELTYGVDEGVFGWANVIAALSHHYRGSDEGLQKALAWSSRNPDKHDDQTTRIKYRSFAKGIGDRAPITLASVIQHVKGDGGAIDRGLLDELLDEVKRISTIDDYCTMRDKVRGLSAIDLPDDSRALVAAAIAEGFGKVAGLTKTEIKKALTRERVSGPTSKSVQALPEWAEGWCYVEKTNEFYHIPTRYGINRDAFNARYSRMPECIGNEMLASTFALNHCRMETYADEMYWPGRGETFEHGGHTYINSYLVAGVVPRTPVSDEDADVIMRVEDHFNLLISDGGDRRILLDWLSYVYSNPGKRVNWSPILQGGQGSGKSFIGEMMAAVMGRRNSTSISGDILNDPYTGWAEGSVLCCVEEIRISGANRFELMDRLKPYITNPEVSIRQKYKPVKVVPNFTNYLFFTNHKDAIPISSDDRRYAIIYSDLQGRDHIEAAIGGADAGKDYFDKLFDAIHHHPDLVAWWLATRQISAAFNPTGRAPATSCHDEIIALSEHPTDSFLLELIEEHECDVINGDVVDITHLATLCKLNGDEMPKSMAIRSAMLRLGYSPMGSRVMVPKLRRMHTVWYRKDKFKSEQAVELVKGFFKDN